MRFPDHGIVHARPARGVRVEDHFFQRAGLHLAIFGKQDRRFGEAVRLAIENATPEWEEEIVASYHVLERAIVLLKNGEKERDYFEERHHRFHRALISACPLISLREFCDDLYIRKTRYRRLLGGYGFTAKEVIGEHRVLMDAVLSRKVPRAQQVIRAHIAITNDVIAEVLRAKGTGKLSPGTKTKAKKSRR